MSAVPLLLLDLHWKRKWVGNKETPSVCKEKCCIGWTGSGAACLVLHISADL